MKYLEKKLFDKGFAKGSFVILSPEDLEELRTILKIMRQEEMESNLITAQESLHILGKNKRLDQIIEKILLNGEIKKTLEKTSGKNYAMHADCAARFSDPDDKGLYIHQDAVGETTFSFLVTDQKEGTTACIPGSHLLIPFKNVRIAEFLSFASSRLLRFTKFFLSPLKGLAGEYYFFFNRLFHGRITGNKKNTQISLFFNFYPVALPENKEMVEVLKQKTLKLKDNYQNINSNYLKNLTSHEIYKKNIDIFNKSDERTPISLNLLSFFNFIKSPIFYFSALIKILILELIFWPIYVLRIVTKLKKKFI